MTCRAAINGALTVFACDPGSTPACRCRCPEACEHVWTGEAPIHDSRGRVCGSTTICARCGMSAMDHDLRVLP